MDNLLEIKNLTKKFPVYSGFFSKPTSWTSALNGVNFFIKKGETLALAGESGCGKTTLGRCILRLEQPNGGEILYCQKNILNYTKKEMKNFRTKAQMIFQNPYASLNPKMTVFQTLEEPLIINKYKKPIAIERIEEIVELVGLNKLDLKKYPHEFSGGQRQRIAIARALVLKPEFVVADEPVSALDVSIQAQIINLLRELKEKLNLTMIFISHDLSVIKHVANRVAVMNNGEIVEIADVKELYSNPQSDYTKTLLSAIPTIKNKN